MSNNNFFNNTFAADTSTTNAVNKINLAYEFKDFVTSDKTVWGKYPIINEMPELSSKIFDDLNKMFSEVDLDGLKENSNLTLREYNQQVEKIITSSVDDDYDHYAVVTFQIETNEFHRRGQYFIDKTKLKEITGEEFYAATKKEKQIVMVPLNKNAFDYGWTVTRDNSDEVDTINLFKIKSGTGTNSGSTFKLYLDDRKKFDINGKDEGDLDSPIKLVNDEIYVPENFVIYLENYGTKMVALRKYAEDLGWNVTWYQKSNRLSESYAELVKDNHTILIFYRTISNTDAKVDGEYKTLEVRAEINNDRLYIPYSFASEFIK
jgi:hypothetical protein